MKVYEKVVLVSKTYLGPATESFIARQCKSHLKKDPAALLTSDLATLAKWMEISGSLLMEQSKAAELSKQIASITE